jgi:hypothetical protein
LQEPESNRELKIDQFSWAIPRRAKSQELLLRLYQYLERNPDLEQNRERRGVFGLLVGTGFSLWRAVFLAQPVREWGGNASILEGARQLLEKLLENNAFAYGDEKRIEEWSVGYYLNNAYYRTEAAIQRLGTSVDSPPIAAFLEQKAKGITADSPQTIWDTGYEAALAILAKLEERTN